MQPVVTDGVAWSVCWSITIVSLAKTAELIQMSFLLWTWVGQRNHVLDGSPTPSCKSNFEGEGVAHCKVYRLSAVSCAKMAKPITMPFEIWAWVGPRKHILDGVHISATWRIRLNYPCG